MLQIICPCVSVLLFLRFAIQNPLSNNYITSSKLAFSFQVNSEKKCISMLLSPKAGMDMFISRYERNLCISESVHYHCISFLLLLEQIITNLVA